MLHAPSLLLDASFTPLLRESSIQADL